MLELEKKAKSFQEQFIEGSGNISQHIVLFPTHLSLCTVASHSIIYYCCPISFSMSPVTQLFSLFCLTVDNLG